MVADRGHSDECFKFNGLLKHIKALALISSGQSWELTFAEDDAPGSLLRGWGQLFPNMTVKGSELSPEKVSLLMIDFNVPDPPAKGRPSQFNRTRLKVRSYSASPASLPPVPTLNAVRGLRVMRPGIAGRPSLPVVQPQVLPLTDPIVEDIHPIYLPRASVPVNRPCFHLNIPLDVIPKPKEEAFNLDHARLEIARLENRKMRQTTQVSPIWLDPAFIAPV
jgi:hypothetical protein